MQLLLLMPYTRTPADPHPTLLQAGRYNLLTCASTIGRMYSSRTTDRRPPRMRRRSMTASRSSATWQGAGGQAVQQIEHSRLQNRWLQQLSSSGIVKAGAAAAGSSSAARQELLRAQASS